jgi:hypothetical protein
MRTALYALIVLGLIPSGALAQQPRRSICEEAGVAEVFCGGPAVPHRRDPEVIEDKTRAPVPLNSGAAVSIIRNLKNQEYKVPRDWPSNVNDSCCSPPWDKSCCFQPLWKMRE